MLGRGTGTLTVDVLGMHVGGGFRGPLVGGRERAGAHAEWAGASLTYSYRGRDGQMEEKVIRRNEGWSKRRGDKNAQDILSSCTQTR